ncbi:non-ribosomal peptide synthetase [Rickettsiella endosymbiont of Dermanyssus gallinae]|uniref:non-ribosomal peptide synthetase n=1 Tax=Rickettsiella endosymbiont of Dermanyssus gallinae TaxID=2856608 RepID=UPI001C52905C|nr:non-ribosomal peptide synthetase [Rickettsiella endosymbiont of Dermanyssus gallinae]
MAALRKNKIHTLLLNLWKKVLQTEEINLKDKFIALGGNSLSAIQIIHKINELLGIHLPLDTIFKHDTITKLSDFIEKSLIKQPTLEKEIEKKTISGDAGTLLTPSQQQIYFLAQQSNNASIAYHVPLGLNIKGNLNISLLEKALNTIIHRHDIFRSFFRASDNGINHFFQKDINIKLSAEYIENKDLQKEILVETRKIIDLHAPLLMRVRLFKLSEQTHFLLIRIHHIITDAWSLSLFKNELVNCLNTLSNGKYPNLVAIKENFSDFISHQTSYLNNRKIRDDLKYWYSKLNTFTEITFPSDFKRPTIKKFQGRRYKFTINKDIFEKLNSFNIKNNTTSFMVMASIVSALLSRYNRQEDIVIGFPISGRDNAEFSNTMGLFLNTLVLRSHLYEEDNFESFLLRVKQDLLDAFSHQNLPFSRLVKELNIPRCQNRNPIFQVMLVWQDSVNNADIVLPAMTITSCHVDNRSSKFDMTFEFIPSEQGIDCCIEYDTDLYKKSTIEKLSSHFMNLLVSALEDPHKNLQALEFITAQEKNQFLDNQSLRELQLVEPTTLHALFEEQAARFPNHIALRCGELILTYKELNQHANQLAHYIRQHYSEVFRKSDTILIGLYLDRSANLIISLLAILKAGAAYVPLDPEWPKQRLDSVLADANCPVILTDSLNKTKFSSVQKNLFVVDEPLHELTEFPTFNVKHESNVRDLIYVLYTSGTTGIPKGVCQTHYNVIRLLERGNELFSFSSNDVWVLFHSYTFDFSVWEMWGALRFGGCLVLPSYQETRDPALFRQLVLQNKVTVLNQTPSAFQLFIQAGKENPTRITTLKYVIFGGEALDISLLSDWWRQYPENHPALVNMYGITETTVHTTFKFLKKKDLKRREFSNIGVPLVDMKAYVVDTQGHLVPIGVPGELWLSGFGLSPGYLNRPELNTEKFIPNSFNKTLTELTHHLAELAFSRVYRTGDLVRWLSDGSLEYLGRIDKQLKIKGFRIEAGEIESALRKHTAIEQCLINVLKQGGLTLLVAYYIPAKQDTQNLNDEVLSIELRRYLSNLLPHYAIPKFFIKLDSIPLTRNMKVDYLALPIPSSSVVDNTALTLAMDKSEQTEAEAILTGIWTHILQITDIDKDDNFFHLGGDSITSIRIVTEARKKGFDFSVSDLFKSPTIRNLANYYKGLIREEKIKLKRFNNIKKKQIICKKLLIAPENIDDVYPLAALQAGMLYHSSYATNSAVYLDVFSYTISGIYSKNNLIHAIQKLIAIHPVLRTSYLLDEFDEPIQIVHKTVGIPFYDKDISDLSSTEQADQLEAWIQLEKSTPFQYEQAPLFRITAHVISKTQFVLGIAFHHSILDGWSLATFITKLLEQYSLLHLKKSKTIANQINTNETDWNFKWFVQLEKSAIISQTDQTFWKNELSGFELTDIPRIPYITSSDDKDFQTYRVQIDSSVTSKLMVLAKSINVSLDEIILAAHLKLLSIYSGREDVLSGVVFNGRPAIENIDTTLGLFLNTLPFRIKIEDFSWKKLILSVSEKKKTIYPHRRYPLMKIMQDVKEDPLFNVIFYFTHFHVYKQLSENEQFKIIDQMHYERTNFPLAINCVLSPVTKKLEILFNYETKNYNSDQISSLSNCYSRLLTTIAADIDATHNTFSFLTTEQKQCLLIDWNQTKSLFLKDKPAHELIEINAKKFPQKTALIFNDDSITYSELNIRANQLANYLNQSHTSHLVGLYIDRSLEAIIAMLALWKAGKAYIPIDPQYPKERIKYILNDAQCDCLLTQKSLTQNLGLSGDIKLVYLDDLKSIASISVKKPSNPIKKEKLAYVIYTSGSTGMPKGVMIEHPSLINLLGDMQKKITFTKNDSFLAMTSFSFDISILEVFLPLITGGCCVLADQSGSKDPRWIKEALNRYPITVVQATASKWALLFEYGLVESKCKIKALCGGEALPAHVASQLIAFAESAWNVYGPTETTIWSTLYKLSKEDKFIKPPIGAPLSNTKIYVLDQKLQPVPIGVVGNLYISGVGLARGYLNRFDLTQEKFIENPFRGKDDNYARLYCTGDLARWLPNGNLDFVNRSDHQIKIRGFRVEAGEIEYALLKHKAIKDSVVLLKNSDSTQLLVAFLVKNNNTDILTIKQLRAFLAKKLPYYCIPDKFVFLEKLPTTQNEKIDYRQLQTLEIDEVPLPIDDTPMSSEQLKLAKLWIDILCIKNVSLLDNFFELGGSSLSTLRLISKINEVFSVTLEIKEMIENPVFNTLFDRIQSIKNMKKDNSNQEKTIDFVKPIPNPIVTLKTGGNKTPLFLVHPVGGNVFYYMPFVKDLDNDRPIYAIQDPGIQAKAPLFESLNEMASFYIQVIKQYQPKGPYLIAGSSFGANAVIEMARQLADKGEKIAFVGLIDGWAKYPKEANDNREWFSQNLINQLKSLDKQFSRENLPELLLDLHWHRQQLLVKHTLPNMSDIELTLFKAKQTMEVIKPLESVYNNWDYHCKSVPTVHLVSGDHFTMHFPPHHKSLAKALKQALAEIDF